MGAAVGFTLGAEDRALVDDDVGMVGGVVEDDEVEVER